MRKESPLMTIWDGDKLVGLHIHCPTAACPQPNRLEEELVRIFNEKIELEAEITKLKFTMELHAGDCCSLNNEVELFRGHWEDAEKRCDELYIKNKRLERDSRILRALEAGGVDNWEWYSESLKEIREEEDA